MLIDCGKKLLLLLVHVDYQVNFDSWLPSFFIQGN